VNLAVPIHLSSVARSSLLGYCRTFLAFAAGGASFFFLAFFGGGGRGGGGGDFRSTSSVMLGDEDGDDGEEVLGELPGGVGCSVRSS